MNDELDGEETWIEKVQELRDSGSTVIAPNNLPIRCIRHDGVLLEHEHADHPDYKFPVHVDAHDILLGPNGSEEPFEEVQVHALLWADEFVALLLYEAQYDLWSLKTGKKLKALTTEDLPRLQEKSLSKILTFVSKKIA